MDLNKIKINRRELVRLAGLSAGGALLAGCSGEQEVAAAPQGIVGKDGKRVLPWSNWSGNQSCQPASRLVPKNEEQIIDIVKQTQQRIRCVGSGHSFSALVPTDETLMSTARLRGVNKIYPDTMEADIGGGSRLSTIGEPLWEQGLAMVNMPDIDTQALAGALATSTHGTGATLGSLSSLVNGMRLVTASGEVIECDKDSELFNAARSNLGVLGVVTQARMQLRKSYHIQETSWMMPLEEGLEQAESLRDSHRHFEMYALPHADYILGITLDEIEADAVEERTSETGDAYETFKTISNVIDWLPFMRSFIINTAAQTVEKEVRGGRSFDVFSNLRDIRFNEMEYSIPAEHGPACLREILEAIKKNDIDVIFPLEYRYVKADDIWLSPFYQRDSCAISCHNFHDRDYKQYFAIIEPIFWKYEGRPHWGKIHTLNHAELMARFPRMGDFLKVREHLDPEGKFLNQSLKQAFGLV